MFATLTSPEKSKPIVSVNTGSSVTLARGGNPLRGEEKPATQEG